MKTNISNKFGDMFRRGLNKGEVRYWPPRDDLGRFSHGEAADPEIKRKKIDAAVREAHRRILDNPNEMGRAAYDAAAGQGLSGHDAHEVFQLVDQKLRKEALAKAGTTEGAKKGWETRRIGGKGADPEVRAKALEEGAVHLGNLDSKLESIVNDERDEIEREGENNRKGIPTDYVGMARRQTERRQEGYRLLKQSIETLKTIKPKTKEDADLVGNLLRYAEKDAERASREESEIPWDKQFDLLLTLARGATERAAAAERAELRGKA